MDAKTFLELPVTEWDGAVNELATDERFKLADELTAITQQTARAARYIEARRLGWSHPKAVRAQNSFATKLRRLIGFAYPKQDVSF